MVKVGIAGIGFMGWIHWLAYQKIDGVEVVAVCDVDENRLSGDWTGIQGNFGPPGEKVDLSNVATCNELESFCQVDCDFIDICLPPALHRHAIEVGAQHEKHVFCEKPLALEIADCQSAVEACERAGKLLLVGHVLPYFPEFQAARNIVSSGNYGKLTSAYFKRVISNPTWLPDFFDPNKIGGPLFDLHVHDAHFIRLLAGMPRGVYSRGQLQNGVVRFCDSIFDFEDEQLALTATSGVIDQQGRPFTHGFEIRMERATLQFEYAALNSQDESMPLKVIEPDGTVSPVTIESSDPVDAFVAEIREVVDCVRKEKPSDVLSGNLACDAIKICEGEARSVKSKSRVAFD